MAFHCPVSGRMQFRDADIPPYGDPEEQRRRVAEWPPPWLQASMAIAARGALLGVPAEEGAARTASGGSSCRKHRTAFGAVSPGPGPASRARLSPTHWRRSLMDRAVAPGADQAHAARGSSILQHVEHTGERRKQSAGLRFSGEKLVTSSSRHQGSDGFQNLSPNNASGSFSHSQTSTRKVDRPIGRFAARRQKWVLIEGYSM
jgi:hypothetical protein